MCIPLLVLMTRHLSGCTFSYYGLEVPEQALDGIPLDLGLA